MSPRIAAISCLVFMVGCSCTAPSSNDAATSDASDAAATGIAASIDTAGDSNCVLTRDQRVICWGALSSNRNPDGSTVPGPPLSYPGPIDEARVGAVALCMRTGTSVQCVCNPSWYCANPTIQALGVLHPPTEPLVAISVSANAACGIRPAGSIVCWPGGDQTQAGTGGVAAIAMDDDNICALFGTTASCWPVGGAPYVVPVAATSIRSACGAYCAITPAGEIACDARDCGPHPWSEFVGPAPPGPWAQLEMSDGYSLCGLRSTGEFECWGRDYMESVRPAGEPPSDTRFADIGVGTTHVCGVTLDGHVLCWGVDPPMSPAAPNGYGMLNVPVELR